MRIWSSNLIPLLPTQWLLGQHRECCALRGLGWGKKHATVDFVFRHSPMKLAAYHQDVREELDRRGIDTYVEWFNLLYRGKNCFCWNGDAVEYDISPFPEHDYDLCARDLMDLERKVSDPDKWKLLSRDDLRRLRQVGIWLPVKI